MGDIVRYDKNVGIWDFVMGGRKYCCNFYEELLHKWEYKKI